MYARFRFACCEQKKKKGTFFVTSSHVLALMLAFHVHSGYMIAFNEGNVLVLCSLFLREIIHLK